MAIICKNEADIIEDNLRYHHYKGIDHFVIMDNGSTDGTREIIQALAENLMVELIIFDEPSKKFEKKKWIWSLVQYAKREMGASHVIPCDADEFWYPIEGKSIPDCISISDVNVVVDRKNFVVSEQNVSTGDYFLEPFRVEYPLCYDKKSELNSDHLSLLFANIGPKVAIAPSGLISLNAGFHRAKHLLQYKKRQSEELIVFHYPIRSYDQFLKNVENRAKILRNTPSASMGNHYKRWAKIYESGSLEEEYERMLIKETDMPGLLKVGAVVKDQRMAQLRQQDW